MLKYILLAAALGIAAIGPAKAAPIYSDGFESNALGTPWENGTLN